MRFGLRVGGFLWSFGTAAICGTVVSSAVGATRLFFYVFCGVGLCDVIFAAEGTDNWHVAVIGRLVEFLAFFALPDEFGLSFGFDCDFQIKKVRY